MMRSAYGFELLFPQFSTVVCVILISGHIF
uniref:Uncharacterized protein n=1 Tax=Anguilla anguilla TaxID=7936 RepID=A0A0E9W5U9_ANGAN